ncbi:MAG: hypothetical protein WCI55_07400 [Armatimonadota bacterium]
MIVLALTVFGFQGRPDNAPVQGSVAPVVVAKILKSKNSFDLNSNKAKHITILIFGSCT